MKYVYLVESWLGIKAHNVGHLDAEQAFLDKGKAVLYAHAVMGCAGDVEWLEQDEDEYWTAKYYELADPFTKGSGLVCMDSYWVRLVAIPLEE
jgi:hypothetical protein